MTRHDEAKHCKWEGLTGRITLDMLKNCGLPDHDDSIFIGTCSPKGFGDSITVPLADLGYVKG